MEGDNSLYNNIILRINDIVYPMSLATYIIVTLLYPQTATMSYNDHYDLLGWA